MFRVPSFAVLAIAQICFFSGLVLAEKKHSYTDFKRQTKLWAFDLKDTEGNAFNNETVRGKWTVIGFGFTKCPDLCPMMMADLKRELKSMPAKLTKQLQASPEKLCSSILPSASFPGP